MKNWLYVGAKVVCVDASPHSGANSGSLEEGGVYIVDAITSRPKGLEIAVKGVHLDSDSIDVLMDGRLYWRVGRFRPVPPDTTKAVEALRQLTLDATKRRKVGV